MVKRVSKFAVVHHKDTTMQEVYQTIVRLQHAGGTTTLGRLFTLSSKAPTKAKTPKVAKGAKRTFAAFSDQWGQGWKTFNALRAQHKRFKDEFETELPFQYVESHEWQTCTTFLKSMNNRYNTCHDFGFTNTRTLKFEVDAFTEKTLATVGIPSRGINTFLGTLKFPLAYMGV